MVRQSSCTLAAVGGEVIGRASPLLEIRLGASLFARTIEGGCWEQIEPHSVEKMLEALKLLRRNRGSDPSQAPGIGSNSMTSTESPGKIAKCGWS